MTSLKNQQKLLKDAGKGVLEWGKGVGKAATTVKNLVEGVVTGDKIKIKRNLPNTNSRVNKKELAATEDNK